MDLEFSVKTLLYMSENSALTSSQQSQHSESTPIENNQNNDNNANFENMRNRVRKIKETDFNTQTIIDKYVAFFDSL